MKFTAMEVRDRDTVSESVGTYQCSSVAYFSTTRTANISSRSVERTMSNLPAHLPSGIRAEPLSLPQFRLRRRQWLAGAAGAAGMIATGIPARGQPAPMPAGGGQSAVIDVNRARAAPIPIALPDLQGDAELGRNIIGVIRNDLANSGLFRPIEPAAYIQTGATPPDGVPNFQNWSAIGAQALVTGSAQSAGGGNVRVEFRLWDVLPQTQLQGTAYTTAESNWRRISHIVADVIYQRLLGEQGYFDTRIVYVSRTGPRSRQTTRLAIMDQDGANNRFLTDGSWMVLTPRFHPSKDEIAFMSYANNRPRVYLFNLGSGQQSVLGDFPNMTLSPRFSPDGSSVVMSVTTSGGADIVAVDLASRAAHRLTSGNSIDVSPCYSPDGSQIVFNSDRGGDQQLYIMGSGGGGARRISFGRGRYATPVWSPRGDLIAFTKLGGDTDNFSIGVMHPDGSAERLLSEAWDVEGPTFCPNGRVIMFWREPQGGSPGLASIDITGFNERPVATSTPASDPAWSPLGG
jgi:TolB protein